MGACGGKHFPEMVRSHSQNPLILSSYDSLRLQERFSS